MKNLKLNYEVSEVNIDYSNINEKGNETSKSNGAHQ
jgi:hypothetical protein